MLDSNSCYWCNEPVTPIDRADLVYLTAHYYCAFRAVAGSVAHIEKKCSCYIPGATERDPPNMTKREAALAALELWRKINER